MVASDGHVTLWLEAPAPVQPVEVVMKAVVSLMTRLLPDFAIVTVLVSPDAAVKVAVVPLTLTSAASAGAAPMRPAARQAKASTAAKRLAAELKAVRP